MTKIRIAGFGGQGIILAGELLAFAAVLDGKEGSAIGSYGSAARGGLTCSEIVISNEFIDAPFSEKPDILIALSQESYDKYFDTVIQNGLIIVDSGMVSVGQGFSLANQERKPKGLPYISQLKQFEIPATNIATIELKSPVVANMVMLGALTAITAVVSKDVLIDAIKQTVSNKFIDINLKGIELGFYKGIELIK